MISKMVRNAAMIFLASFALSSAARATCSNASLSGSYGFLHGGTAGDGTPIAGLSQVTFDPATGTYSGVDTQSHDGVITTSALTATYSIASNCLVSATVTLGGRTQNISLVVTSTGFFSLVQRTGVTTEGVGVAQGSPTCTNAGVAGGLAFEVTGTFLSGAPATGPVAFIGELKLAANSSGEGEITGFIAGSEDGTILKFAQGSVTGSYTIAPDCTGTATITPKDGPEMNFSLVVVNGGKQILIIETDANTVVSGTLSAAPSSNPDSESSRRTTTSSDLEPSALGAADEPQGARPGIPVPEQVWHPVFATIP